MAWESYRVGYVNRIPIAAGGTAFVSLTPSDSAYGLIVPTHLAVQNGRGPERIEVIIDGVKYECGQYSNVAYSIYDGWEAVIINGNNPDVEIFLLDGKHAEAYLGRYTSFPAPLDLTISGGAMYPGAFSFSFAPVIPTGWLLCDGAAVSRTQYIELFAAIGTLYGAGDGSTTFNLPDLIQSGGLFLRAQSGVNPLGNVQAAELLSHNHDLTVNSGGWHTHSASSNDAGSHSHTAQSAGAHTHSLSIDHGGAHTHSLATRSEAGGSYSAAGSFLSGTSSTMNTLTSGSSHQHTGLAMSAGSHTHSTDSQGSHSHTITVNSAGSHSHTGSIGNTGGAENRPVNMALLPLIKY